MRAKARLATVLAVLITLTAAASLTASRLNTAGSPPAVTVTWVTVTPAAVAPGHTARFAATITTNRSLSNVIVDFEVYDWLNARIYQTFLRSVHLAANAPTPFSASWTVPAARAAGTYRVRVGVFSSDWSNTYVWNDTGDLFAVRAMVALGVFEPGSPWDGGAALDAYAALVGRKPAVAMWYEDWPDTGFSTANYNVVAARGEMPMLSWAPCSNGVTVEGHPCSDALIAGTNNGGIGVADSYIRQFARGAAAWGRPFYLRFAWEMNASWEPWAPGVNGNTGASFIAMWRHVQSIFVQQGATNARWVWCPNGDAQTDIDIPLTAVYPGDAYVDYVGFDAYNFGTTQSWSSWHSLSSIYSAPYKALAALTSKPIIVGETGSVEQGGNKATWIAQGFLSDLPGYFPRIRAVVWFDVNQSARGKTDWRVDSSPAALAAYRQVAASPLYQGRLPTSDGTAGRKRRM